jgi:hypothetical protein
MSQSPESYELPVFASKEAERAYWWSATPDERMLALQKLREKVYGDLVHQPMRKDVFEYVRLRQKKVSE